MDEDQIKEKMQQVVTLVQGDISSIRTGRANPSIVSDLMVAVYGGQQRLKIQEVATITASDAQTIVIDPWDKSIIGEIRQGILSANVGINPSLDGEVIRISVPPLTTEDRERYVKLLSTKLESGRVMIRQVRGDGMKDIKKAFEDKMISEDEKFSQEKHLQEVTDEYVDKIDTLGEKKKEELLTI
jgi:ribosome recycling factor